MVDFYSLAYVALGLAFAAFVKGAIGLGFPPLAVPLVATFFLPRDAVAIVNVPNLLLTGLILRRGGAPWKVVRGLWPLYVVGIIATVAGTQILASIDRNAQFLVLGVMVLLFVASNLLPVRLSLSPQQTRWVSPIAGLFAGLVQGTTGSSSAILAPFLLSAGFTKQMFVFLISLGFMLQIVTQTIYLTLAGVYAGQNLVLSVATLPPVLLGLWIGFRVQDRIARRSFNLFVLVFLFANSVYLILRGTGVLP